MKTYFKIIYSIAIWCICLSVLHGQTKPEPLFTYSQSNNVVNFKGSGAPYIMILSKGWHWDFGDGQVAEGLEVTHIYEKPGKYNACLKVKTYHLNTGLTTEENYCESLIIEEISNTACKASFTYLETMRGNFVRFEDNSQGNPDQWHWDFGDGSQQEGQNLGGEFNGHQYAKPGKYDVCLTIYRTSDDSLPNSYPVMECKDQFCQTIVVGETNDSVSTCKASFAYNEIKENYIEFNPSDFGYNNQFVWDFGDGTTAESFYLANQYHQYKKPGTYNVCMTMYVYSDTKGVIECKSQICETIVVGDIIDSNPTCKAFFTYTEPVKNYMKFQGEVSSNPYELSNLEWFWDFGDGYTGTGQYLAHKFEKAGKYNVCLTVVKNSPLKIYPPIVLCKAQYCQTIGLGDIIDTLSSCKASFTYEVRKNNHVAFKDHSKGNLEKWSWDFGDGMTAEGEYLWDSDNKVSHYYKKPGIYNVCLTIKSISYAMTLSYPGNPLYCTDKYCQTIVIKDVVDTIPSSCKASFTYAVSENNFVKFEDQSQGHPDRWIWDFGDGTSGEGFRYSAHQYAKPGKYNVCLTVIRSFQGYDPPNDSTINIHPPLPYCKDQYCQTIVVGDIIDTFSTCKASFTYAVSENNFVKFEDHSTGTYTKLFGVEKPSKWFWNFGDGTSAEGEYMSHQYDTPGKYEVCLTIVSGADPNDSIVYIRDPGPYCKDQYCQTIIVGDIIDSSPVCKASYTYSVSEKNYVKFSGQVSSNPDELSNIEWFWDFGDGYTGTGQYLSHQFEQAGKYNVCLTVTKVSPLKIYQPIVLCKDQFCETIVVGEDVIPTPECKAYFKYSEDGINKVNFTGVSSGIIQNCFWSFGDGSTGEGVDVTHEYSKSGNYEVCVTIVSSSDYHLFDDSLTEVVKMNDSLSDVVKKIDGFKFVVYKDKDGKIVCGRRPIAPCKALYCQTITIGGLPYDSSGIDTQVDPNPVDDKSTLNIYKTNNIENIVDVLIYNVSGNLVKEMIQVNIQSNPITLRKEEFGTGLFFYTILSKGKAISKGKFLVN